MSQTRHFVCTEAPDQEVKILPKTYTPKTLGENFALTEKTFAITDVTCTDEELQKLLEEAVAEDGWGGLDKFIKSRANVVYGDLLWKALRVDPKAQLTDDEVRALATAGGLFDLMFDKGTDKKYRDFENISAKNCQLYIRLWHGRRTPDAVTDPDNTNGGWGFEGPLIPIVGMCATYSGLRIRLIDGLPKGAWQELDQTEEFPDIPVEKGGCVVHNGLYYGDWCLMCGPKYDVTKCVQPKKKKAKK